MRQGYITRIGGDTGWLRPDGWTSELSFRHWALAPEQGGTFPRPGAYVQFIERRDPQHGAYISEIRQIADPAYGRPGPTTKTTDSGPRGVRRVEADGSELTMDQVSTEQRAGVKRETGRPQHTFPTAVSTDWELPSKE